ncbi:MAG: hypothetical protein N2490_09510 [Ignavibacteria bacterium]|nr:hypothetical protein [Ignavibacteria bacterium]
MQIKNKVLSSTPTNIILLLIFLSLITLVFTLDITYLINFAHDDSFYYLKTALNFSQSGSSTFDGINKTNGYHPLYFWIISSYFFVLNLFLDTNPELLFRFVCLLHLLLILLISLIVNKIIQKHFDDSPKANFFSKLIIFSLLIGLILIRDVGTEAHITVILVLLFYYWLLKEEAYNLKYKLYLGVILFFLFLSRIDLVVSFLIPLLFYLVSKEGFKGMLKKYILILLFVCLSIIVNALYNFIVADSIFSVSSMIANTFPKIVFKDNIVPLFTRLGDSVTLMKFLMLIFLIIISIYLIIKYNEKYKSKSFLLAILLSLGCLLFCFQHLFFNKYGLRSWYMAVPSICMLLILINILPQLKNKSVLKYTSMIVLIIIISYLLAIRVFNNKFRFVYQYSKEIEKLTTESDVIFQIDFSGIVSFFSSRKIINGDGLINSLEYYQSLKKNDIREFLKKTNVNYYSFFVWKSFMEDERYIYDYSYKDFSNGLFFKIEKRNIIFYYPYHYEFLLVNNTGYWYLAKFSL